MRMIISRLFSQKVPCPKYWICFMFIYKNLLLICSKIITLIKYIAFCMINLGLQQAMTPNFNLIVVNHTFSYFYVKDCIVFI